MATDIIHTAEVLDAVIAVLKGDGSAHTGGLPSTWFDSSNDEFLPLLDFGDLADYAGSLPEDMPAIIVRGLGADIEDGFQSKTWITAERVRVVHVRQFERCYHSTDEVARRNMTRARLYYAKVISKALFNDPKKLLATIATDGTRTEVSLTCADSDGAQIINCVFRQWDFGLDIGNPNATEDVATIRALDARAWAIACDFDVIIQTG